MQTNFLDALDPLQPFQRPITPNPTVPPEDRERLTGQCAAILERLKRGPCTNVEFVGMHILRYSARIFELRNLGHEIKAEAIGGGVVRYQLESPPSQEPA